MRRLIWVLVVVGLVAAAAEPVRVMSYNVKDGRGMDGVRDYGRVARVIAGSGADVVAVQEIDSATARSGGDYVLGELARATGMHGTFAAAIDYDGGRYGIGVLSREEPVSVRRVPLPGREEARVLLVAEFERYVLCCTHLSLTEEDRLASLAAICEVAATATKPLLLAGDFNAEPQSPFMTELQRHFTVVTDTAVHTFPAPEPTETIDYIAVSRSTGAGVTVASGPQVLCEPVASDHRPVVVTLNF